MRLMLVVIAMMPAMLGLCAEESPEAAEVPAWAAAPEPGKWQWIWINRVAEFRRENAVLDEGRKNIVFLGDSLIQGFPLARHFPDLPVLNRGIVSDGLADFPGGRNVWRGITRRLGESVFDCNPSHVFLLIGTNDVGPPAIPMDYWFGVYKYVTLRIRSIVPDVKIVAITCPPTGTQYSRHQRLNARILEWNTLIRAYAAEERFPLIDLYALLVGDDGLLPENLSRDGLHFNRIGHDRLAAEVRRILQADGILQSPPAAVASGAATPARDSE